MPDSMIYTVSRTTLLVECTCLLKGMDCQVFWSWVQSMSCLIHVMHQTRSAWWWCMKWNTIPIFSQYCGVLIATC